jgi:hypothetical protein
VEPAGFEPASSVTNDRLLPYSRRLLLSPSDLRCRREMPEGQVPSMSRPVGTRIVSLEGSRLLASLQDASGKALDLTLDLQLDPSARTFSGSLHAA